MKSDDKFDNASDACGECQCLSCELREYSLCHSYTECNRCENGCNNIPIFNCDEIVWEGKRHE